jgi:hypothetical protein
MLDRLMAIDPAWWGGHPLVMKAAYYSVIPSLLGGDMKEASRYFDEAVKAGPGYFFTHWARAVYLYKKTGNRGGFEEDLRFIISRPVTSGGSLYAWNAWFRHEAERLLAESDRLF